MRHAIFCALLPFLSQPLLAGQVGYDFPWVQGPAADQLVVNNEDYTGELEANPNQLQLNQINEALPDEFFAQDIFLTERVIPVKATGGITEYAVSLAGTWGSDSKDINTLLAVQVGFGTGDNFLLAREVVPGLVFDNPDNVDPPVPSFYFFDAADPEPLMGFVEHQGDTLLFQGANPVETILGEFRLSSIFDGRFFRFSLDVPDLTASVRDLYALEELVGLAPTDTAFTLRVIPIPEPSTMTLALFGLMGLFASKRR